MREALQAKKNNRSLLGGKTVVVVEEASACVRAGRCMYKHYSEHAMHR